MRRAGWLAFLSWAPVGAAWALAIAAAPSFGLFVLPPAALALVLAARALRIWPEGLGAAVGIGAVLLVVAFLNSDYRACPEGGLTLAPGQHEISCGGFDPAPFLVLGLVVAAAAVVTFGALLRRVSR
jgi:hypothetical protein